MDKINGITPGSYFYVAENNRYRIIVTDIDIDPESTSITFGDDNMGRSKTIDFKLHDVFKQFPNIDTIFINDNVGELLLSNFMFPNVKHIVATGNNSYRNSKNVLIKVRYGSNVLLNSFCKDTDEKIDLSMVEYIGENALKGCKSTKIKWPKRISRVSKDLFSGYINNIKPASSNVVSIMGYIIRMGDINDEVDLKDDKIQYKGILTTMDGINSMVVHKFHTLEILNVLPPKTIITDKSQCRNLATLLSYCTSQHIEIVDSPYFKTIDDIIYSNNGKSVIYCNPKKTGELSIPEGVIEIKSRAFAKSELQKVILPASLRNIEDNAFFTCKNLSELQFSEGISCLMHKFINCCYNLKYLELPKSITYINYNVLRGFTGEIKFNDGIQFIGCDALARVNNDTLVLPQSVIEFTPGLSDNEKGRISSSVQNIYMQSLPTNLISCLLKSTESHDFDQIDLNSYLENYVISIHVYGKEFHLPRYMSGISSKIENLIEEGDTEGVALLFKCISNNQIKQLTAIRLYELGKHTSVKEYLRRSGASIIKNLIKINKEDILIKFISFNLVTKATLKSALKQAQSHNMTQVSAYVLQALNSDEANGKGSFSL